MLRQLVKPHKLLAYEFLYVANGNRLHYLRQHSEVLPSMLRARMHLSFRSRRTELLEQNIKGSQFGEIQWNYIQHKLKKMFQMMKGRPLSSACNITLR